MSDALIVYRKTSAGLAEVQDRRLHLPRKTFSLLLAIDGRRSREQLCSSLSAYGDVARQLDDLEALGLIESFDPEAARRGPETRPGARSGQRPPTAAGARTEPGPMTVAGPGTLTDPATVTDPVSRPGPGTIAGPGTITGPGTRPGPETIAGPGTRPGPETITGTPPSSSDAPRAVIDSNLIDIRTYLGPPATQVVDDALLPREAMVEVLSRHVDLENYELLHAIEEARTRDALIALLPAYLTDTAKRLPPVAYSAHVASLSKAIGLSVTEMAALMTRRAPAR